MGRAKRDEQVTLTGRVRGSPDRAVFAEATLTFGGIETPVELRSELELETAEGVVIVELARNPVVRPELDVASTWAVLKQHPTRPDGAFLDGDRGRLRGTWIVPGNSIAVAGYAKDYSFVPDTGTHRDAPERRIARLRAIAVGIGDAAELTLQRALRDRDEELARRAQPQVKPNPLALRSFVYAAGCLVVAIAALVVNRERHDLVGIAFSATYLGVLYAWRGARLEAWPRGGHDRDGLPTSPNIVLWLTLLLAGPVLPILFFVAKTAATRNASLVGAWILLGLYPAIAVVRAAFGKPESVTGVVLLPRNAVARWLLVGALVGLWIAAIAIAAPHMTGSPM